jgi:4-hydroxy 2-oxovalerate aldolase
MALAGVEILECTLRDGSYAIDFQFTARDTALIAAALENAGFNLIEIGHGLGLNAANAGKGAAAATDEEYMQAAASTLKRAQWGMFFIPGIGRREDLDRAAGYGMSFVRIGTNANEVPQSAPFVEHAKKLGFHVSANLMKSYALPPKELTAQAHLSEQYGVDMVCLVDSAGTMMPEDIRTYVRSLQDTVVVPLGLHCHDNLSLGMANVLMAIDCGVRRVDSTLQGMGRGGGNPVTEVLVTVLKKRGVDLGIDHNQLMDVSARVIKPMLHDKGWDSINIISGYAGFHSSYLDTILKFADKYKVDARDLIVRVCEMNQISAPEDLVEETAQQLQQQAGRSGLHMVSLPRLDFAALPPSGSSDTSFRVAVRAVARDVQATARKKGRRSVFNIVADAHVSGKAVVSRFVQEEFDYVIGSMRVDNLGQLQEALEALDGTVDILLVDADPIQGLGETLAAAARRMVKKSRVVGYQDQQVWIRSVVQGMAMLMDGLAGQRVTVSALDPLSRWLVLTLLAQGAAVTLTQNDPRRAASFAEASRQLLATPVSLEVVPDPIAAVQRARVLVRFDRQPPLITQPMVEAMPVESIIFDAGIGTVAPEALAAALNRGIRIIRPDMRAALAAELAFLLGAKRIVDTIMGRGEINGIPVVAGGLIGKRGDIVVDSISNPSRVVGVADGQGLVMHVPPRELVETIGEVEQIIMKQKIRVAG